MFMDSSPVPIKPLNSCLSPNIDCICTSSPMAPFILNILKCINTNLVKSHLMGLVGDRIHSPELIAASISENPLSREAFAIEYSLFYDLISA